MVRRRSLPLAALVLFSTVGGYARGQPAAASEAIRIAVFGASGRTGSAIVDEALRRGHLVLGIGRNPSNITLEHEGLSVAAGDILDTDSVVELIDGYDVVVNAVRGPIDADDIENSLSVAGTRSLVASIRRLGDPGPRMVMVGGGRTLHQGDGYEDWDESPLEAAHQAAIAFLRTVDDVEWSVLAPPLGGMLSTERIRTGRYRLGRDVALRNPDGSLATISLDDFGVAMLDEIEAPKQTFRLFTVAW